MVLSQGMETVRVTIASEQSEISLLGSFQLRLAPAPVLVETCSWVGVNQVQLLGDQVEDGKQLLPVASTSDTPSWIPWFPVQNLTILKSPGSLWQKDCCRFSVWLSAKVGKNLQQNWARNESYELMNYTEILIKEGVFIRFFNINTYQLILISSDSSEHCLREHPCLVPVPIQVRHCHWNMTTAMIDHNKMDTRLELVHRIQNYLSIL